MMKVLYYLLAVVMMSGACHRGDKSYSSAKAAADEAREAIQSDLKVGASETELAAFFERHRWSASYNYIEHCFQIVPFRTPDNMWVVFVRIHVDDRMVVTRSEVSVVGKGL